MSIDLCGFKAGLDQPLFLIAGPCVIESLQLQMDTAGTLQEITGRLGINFIFKSSFERPTAPRARVSVVPASRKDSRCSRP